jgi:hypothetical protein
LAVDSWQVGREEDEKRRKSQIPNHKLQTNSKLQ